MFTYGGLITFMIATGAIAVYAIRYFRHESHDGWGK